MSYALGVRGEDVLPYPDINSSSSAPYIFGCHVPPQPSLKRGGIIFAMSPFKLGLRKSHTWTRSGNSLRSGSSKFAVDIGSGRVQRL